MRSIDRRSFMKTAAVGSALAAAWKPASSRAAGASERVRVAVVGCGGQGKSHLNSLASLAEAEIAAVCDVDQQRLAAAAELTGGAKPVSDFRRVLQAIDMLRQGLIGDVLQTKCWNSRRFHSLARGRAASG